MKKYIRRVRSVRADIISKKMIKNKINLAVIIPTFNESQNIVSLIKSVKANIGKGDVIVVVDDNSPDSTGKIVDKMKKREKNLHVIHRTGKNGRGSAVLDGFKFAKKFEPEFYIEMDADFSHKPSDIPRLVRKIAQGADVVIGSRYLKGSKIENWSSLRKAFSKAANIYARAVLNIPISDYTNGFRIYAKDAALFLLSQKLITSGYILLSETAYKLKNANFSISEIPIIFVNRERGQSNTNLMEVKNAFLGIIKIRFSK